MQPCTLDEHGRIFNRQHDAEFKLLSDFCAKLRGRESWWPFEGSGTLWSRKPLCASCIDAVRQVREMLPRLQLTVCVAAPPRGSNGASSSCPCALSTVARQREASAARASAAAEHAARPAGGRQGPPGSEACAELVPSSCSRESPVVVEHAPRAAVAREAPVSSAAAVERPRPLAREAWANSVAVAEQVSCSSAHGAADD
ncbi:unnamed protein product [Prorocentrum cordatum]|uniref:Uncharacterized protein n=1 Tax=Prorocentrum cordatum TaxID=2364126 RepID=A0ABN9Q131_9DINO|nr:unnamed protein product [Polarella glacialis]